MSDDKRELTPYEKELWGNNMMLCEHLTRAVWIIDDCLTVLRGGGDVNKEDLEEDIKAWLETLIGSTLMIGLSTPPVLKSVPTPQTPDTSRGEQWD